MTFAAEFAVFTFGVLVLLALAWILAPLASAQAPDGSYTTVHTTFYLPTGNPTASGEWPHAGTAGCSYDIPLGTVLQFTNGLTVRCNDRGNDAAMAPHVDVFCASSYAECLQTIPGVGNWTQPQPVTVKHWGP